MYFFFETTIYLAIYFSEQISKVANSAHLSHTSQPSQQTRPKNSQNYSQPTGWAKLFLKLISFLHHFSPCDCWLMIFIKIWAVSPETGSWKNLGVLVVIGGHNLPSPSWNKVIWSTKNWGNPGTPGFGLPDDSTDLWTACEQRVIYLKSAPSYSKTWISETQNIQQ